MIIRSFEFECSEAFFNDLQLVCVCTLDNCGLYSLVVAVVAGRASRPREKIKIYHILTGCAFAFDKAQGRMFSYHSVG